MASATDSNDGVESSAAPAARLGMVQLLMAVVGAVVISVLLLAGTFYYLAKSGKLSLQASTSTSNAPAAAKTEAAAVVPPSHPLALEPMVVNLADEGGKTYLRLGLTLKVLDPVLKKGEKPKEEKPKDSKGPNEAEAAVRDCVLQVLGRQTAEALLAPEGKERLKVEIKAEIAQHGPEIKVSDVYFTEFLVQR